MEKTFSGDLWGTKFSKLNESLIVTEKKIYFGKTFFFRDTYGLALIFILDKLQMLADTCNIQVSPCFKQFQIDARSAGWSDKRIEADICEAIGEKFGAIRAKELKKNWLDLVLSPTKKENNEK